MNWPTVPLEKLAKISGGSTPKRNNDVFWNGDVPWVTPSDLPAPGTLIADIEDTKDHITQEGLNSCSAPLLPLETVLFSSRATIGKIGISKIPMATNQGFANFTPNPGVEPKYLAYALQYFTPQITTLAGSTTFKEVSRGAIRKFKIPLPPHSEQQRIVELLDQADALRRKRTDANEKAQRILPALFMKMFGDPATNPMGWPTEKLGNVCEIVSGATPRTNQPQYYGGDILWATPKDLSQLNDFIIDATEKTLTDEGYQSCSTRLMPVGSVLLSSRAPIGLVAVTGKSVCTNQGFKSLVPGNMLCSFYVYTWLKLRGRYLDSLGRGATFKEISKKIACLSA